MPYETIDIILLVFLLITPYWSRTNVCRFEGGSTSHYTKGDLNEFCIGFSRPAKFRYNETQTPYSASRVHRLFIVQVKRLELLRREGTAT
jgi:hypothetical protein